MIQQKSKQCEGGACTVQLILDPLCPSEPKEKNQTDVFNIYVFFFFCLPGKNLCASPQLNNINSTKKKIKLMCVHIVHWLLQPPHELHLCQGMSN